MELEDALKRGWIVLYFYPKDFTPGCTTETRDFQDHIAEFKKLGAQIFGVSADSVERHKKFHESNALEFSLISDPDLKICESYGVWRMKKIFGKSALGIVRSTFLINPSGTLIYIWPKVRVKGHASEVLAKLSELVASQA